MILVDSGAWYALADNQERHHGHALSLFSRTMKGEFGRVLTTDYILDETYTLLRMRLGAHSVRAMRDLQAKSSSLQLLRVSDTDFDRALDLMLTHDDRRWSFTDCTSFILMRDLQITNAFTFDHNFAEAGFRTLPEE
jgi:predicted nucleic acid-binding protein